MSDTTTDPFLFQEEENDFNLKEALYKYLVHWKWFVLSITLALIPAYILKKQEILIYNTQARILIKDDKKGMVQDGMLKGMDIFPSNKVVDNEKEILESYFLMEQVVKS